MGLKIEGISDDSYASSVGFLKGDILDSCNSVALNKNEDLVGLIQSNLGEDLAFIIIRGNFAKEIKAKGKPLDVEVVPVQSNAEYAQKADPTINTEVKPASSTSNVQYSSSIEKSALNEVIVTDINMPFTSMVSFMVKWAIASIPAFIILFILFSIVVAIFGSILS